MSNKIAGLLALTLLASTLAHAGPSGPSAKAAARLKKNPPAAWIAHYLPDDRYKVAGGVWKYVSTNLDTYYHRPDSPNMLRQPANNVIGFPSAQAAEEAGYRPDPSDGTAQIVQNRADQKMMAQDAAIGGGTGIPSAPGAVKRSGRVLLADGRSILTVPVGWQRLVSQQGKDSKNNVSIDLMAHPGTGNMALLVTMNFPNVDVGRELSSGKAARDFKKFGTAANSTGEISNVGGGRVGDWATNAKIQRTKWGGLNGIAVSPPPRQGKAYGNIIMVGRGNKLYMLQLMTKGKTAPNTAAMIKSFQPR